MCNDNIHVCFCSCKRVKVHVYIQRLSAYAYTYVCACICVHLNPFVLFLHLSSSFSPSISTSCCLPPLPFLPLSSELHNEQSSRFRSCLRVASEQRSKDTKREREGETDESAPLNRASIVTALLPARAKGHVLNMNTSSHGEQNRTPNQFCLFLFFFNLYHYYFF